MLSLAQGGRLEEGKGKNVEERKAIVIYGHASSRRTSAQIFRCSQASERCDAARPKSSDIIAFLVKEPEELEVQTSQLTLGDV